ncbi:MAG: hypothetical protein ACRD92_00915 [Nitrosopumilaceae archaeon]
MTYCPNCGKQNTSLLKDPNGKLYQLEDDLNQWSYNPQSPPIEKNIVTYTSYVCGECGNFFAIGEAHAGQTKEIK